MMRMTMTTIIMKISHENHVHFSFLCFLKRRKISPFLFTMKVSSKPTSNATQHLFNFLLFYFLDVLYIAITKANKIVEKM